MNKSAVIGFRIKELRTEKKYTLKYLSEQTGLSIGFLSQFERGLTSIAIDSLEKIAQVLEVELSSFFDLSSPQETKYVVRSYEKETTLVNSEIIEYALTDHLTSFDLLPRLVEIMPPLPEEKETLELYNHTGEEFIYILEGILTMNIDSITYQLYPGDSVHIPSCIPHNWSNKTNHITKILTVHSPNPLKKEG